MNEGTAFQEAVDYIHGLILFGWKPGLERFGVLCERLGNPQARLRCIHIGGTNGKGSVTAMVSSILTSAGYKVGSYYSPYVYNIRERIQLDGCFISKSDFTRLTEQIRPIAAEIGETELEHPTEFEVKTALAFLYFIEQGVDFAALEVGLGGRLDATNIVNPLVSVITNVTMDHMDRLGDTIPEIAFEKAGIIKQDGHLVTASVDPEALDVFVRTCRERNSLMWHARPADSAASRYEIRPVATDRSYEWTMPAQSDDTSDDDALAVDGMRAAYEGVRIGMQGDFQRANAAVAIGAIEALQRRGYAIPESAIRTGLESAYVPGRLEVLQRSPTLLIDGAHNLDGARKLADALTGRFSYKRLILVMGMVSGHSIGDVVGTLAPMADAFIATAAGSERSASAADVAEAASMYCADVTVVEPVKDAVERALSIAGPDDLVCVAGSFYVLNETPRPDNDQQA